MGGSLFIIPGKIDGACLEKKPLPKSLLDWIIFRQRYSGPRENDMGNSVFLEIPSANFEVLIIEFKEALQAIMDPQNEATSLVFNYLEMEVMSVYLRGERDKQTATENWYIQVSFSGCAGMSEITAQVCVHWFELWFQAFEEEITKKYFLPLGFTPADDFKTESEGVIFIPTEYTSYAMAEINSETQVLEWKIDQAFNEESSIDETKNISLSPHDIKECLCQFCRSDLSGRKPQCIQESKVKTERWSQSSEKILSVCFVWGPGIILVFMIASVVVSGGSFTSKVMIGIVGALLGFGFFMAGINLALSGIRIYYQRINKTRIGALCGLLAGLLAGTFMAYLGVMGFWKTLQ